MPGGVTPLAVGQIWILKYDRPFYPRWNDRLPVDYLEGEKFLVKELDDPDGDVWILWDGQGRPLRLRVWKMQHYMDYLPENHDS